MNTEPLQGWDNFFVAEAGASAALAGLLFVAVSINLARILQFETLPRRVLEALVSLLSVLVIATVALVPRQTPFGYGIEFAVIGLISWAIQTKILFTKDVPPHPKARKPTRVILNQVPPWPFMVAGGLLMTNHPNGIYWVLPGVLLSFLAGLFDAWVLLIEIQR